jgi:hypothetical protein
MGTAHGAEELGLRPHGHACLAGAGGRYIGFCPGYGHIWKIQYWKGRQKYSASPITLSHDGILTNGFFFYKAWDTGDADRGIRRVNRATRARAIGTYLW